MWNKPVSDVSYRIRRRAVSVPADHGVRSSGYDIGGGVGANKAHVIAHHAHQDTDAIAAASKRNDRDFLHEVSAKMANLTTNTSIPPRSRDVSPSVHRRTPQLSTTPTPVSSYLRHAASLTPDDNYDIAAYLQRAPSTTPLGSHRHVTGRAISLPPVSVHHTLQAPRSTAPRWYPSSVSYYGRPATGRPVTSGRVGGSIPFPVGLPPRPPSGDRLDAITDSVVGVARTSQYGDIVIGIPYKKHYMFDVQREFDDLDTQSLPAVQSRTSYAPHFADTRPASLALPNGALNLSRPYSRASYAGPSNGYRPSIHGVNGGLYPSSAADLDDVVSIKSYPGAFVGHRSTTRTTRRPLTTLNRYTSHIGDYENDIDELDFDDSGATSQLSSLKRDAKSILSRYSMSPSTPTRNGPKHMTADELDHKYGQIVSGMQAKNRIQPRSDYAKNATASLPPYPSTPKKPEMSDTRRKLRELLCRSRNDPHYFDS